MLAHAMMQPSRETRGIYGYSRNGVNWTLLPDEMWRTVVPWANGSVTSFVRRQAPTLYFDAVGTPIALQTAVDHHTMENNRSDHPEGGCWWGTGWTFIEQVNH